MGVIVDRRNQKAKKVIPSKERFLDKNREAVEEAIRRVIDSQDSITDTGKNRKIKISKKDLDSNEHISKERTNQDLSGTSSGNKKFRTGDKVPIKEPEGGGKGSAGANSEDENDTFQFLLSEEEFLNYYFSDLALPNFIKSKLGLSKSMKYRRVGYSPQGIRARLSIKKTFERALARKIATRAGGKKPIYLDDSDLRYKLIEKRPVPNTKAVMFCIMDVSASMTQDLKDLAKRFYILLYLFLKRNYEHVEVRFITHTSTAKEVTEQEFFYGQRSGGTCMSPAFELANRIIQEEYPLDTWNIYCAQASDGDNWEEDNNKMDSEFNKLLNAVQYFSYINVSVREIIGPSSWNNRSDVMRNLAKTNKKVGYAFITSPKDVILALYKLFKRDSA